MSLGPRSGDHEPSNLAALASKLYIELKSTARRHLIRERWGHTLQATALVNETYVRLSQQGEQLFDREQFLAVASYTMRRVLIDYARRRGASRRGGARLQVTFDESLYAVEPNLDVFALEEALRDLEQIDARPVRIVEMRVFGGLTNDEIAAVLKVSSRTVKRDWIMARSWLQERLDSGFRE
jgi:RNA polymerase sigma-70 factor (ECF subfamily)